MQRKRQRGGSPRGLLDLLLVMILAFLTMAVVWKTTMPKRRRLEHHSQAMEVGTIAMQESMSIRQRIASERSHGSPDKSASPPKPNVADREATHVAVDEDFGKLPSVEGLEIHPVDGKNRSIPQSELFVHQGNYNRLMDHYAGENGELVIHNNRSFPTADMRVLRRYNFTTCAIVGNSGSLLNSSFGSAIDSHSAVLRINQAPPGLEDNSRFKKHVGARTTFRMINTRWTSKYGSWTGQVDEGKLPLEYKVTVIVTRSRPRQYDEFVMTLKKVRTDVTVLYLSSRVVGAAHRLLVGYRERLTEQGIGPFEGGDTPSSGFLATYLMLQACDSVTLYGFGLEADDGEEQQYHYFHLFSPKHSKKKNSMNKTHSFNTEKELLGALAKAGLLTFCSYKPKDSKHNRRCGMQQSSKADRRHEAEKADSFMELDLAKAIKPIKNRKIID